MQKAYRLHHQSLFESGDQTVGYFATWDAANKRLVEEIAKVGEQYKDYFDIEEIEIQC